MAEPNQTVERMAAGGRHWQARASWAAAIAHFGPLGNSGMITYRRALLHEFLGLLVLSAAAVTGGFARGWRSQEGSLCWFVLGAALVCVGAQCVRWREMERWSRLSPGEREERIAQLDGGKRRRALELMRKL
jgi:hypothetical protein